MPIERQLIFQEPPFGTDNYHSRLWKYMNAMARGKRPNKPRKFHSTDGTLKSQEKERSPALTKYSQV